MKNILWLLFLLVKLSALPLYSSSFTDQNKPIDPLLISSLLNPLRNTLSEISVSDFHSKEVLPCNEPLQQELKNQGFIGRAYRYIGIESKTKLLRFIYYKILQDLGNNLYLIYVYEEDIGHAFTSLGVLEKQGDKLRLVQRIAAGDRCQGEIESISLQNGNLYYKQKVNPYMFMTFMDPALATPQVERFLPSCAIYCLGSLSFVYDLSSAIYPRMPKILTLDILKEYCVESNEDTLCFNTLVKEYIKEGKTTLNLEELRILQEKFKTLCYKSQ